MSKHNKLEALKAELKAELNNVVPDMVKIGKLRSKIMMLGLGLTGRDIKPF